MLTFTNMPQQLFLFDEPQPEKKEEQPATTTNTGLVTEMAADEEPVVMELNVNEINSSIEQPVINPFEEVQQQRKEQIETMLLLPNVKRGRKSFKDMDAETILVEVPEDEVLFQKQYYPLRTVAEWFGITPSQLRKWETEFAILKPKKNAKGDRFFRPEYVKNLQLIYHLIRKRKFTSEGARQYLKENRKKLQANMQLNESLNNFKQFLNELKAIAQ